MNRLFSFLLILVFAMTAAADLPRRTWFGAQLQPTTDEERAASGLDFTGGITLGQVMPNSSAETAGLQTGDIIIKFAGESLPDVQSFVDLLHDQRAGRPVQFEYVRGGKMIPNAIRLLEYPRETSDEFEIIYDDVKIDGDLRRVIVTKPAGSGPFPFVVLMGGLGCYSLDVPPPTPFAYRTILYALTRAGFATVRLEKTGMGDSEGQPCAQQSFFDEVHGYDLALPQLQKLKYLDADRMIYFGHSMGGLVAPVVYKDIPCAGIVAYGTGGIRWSEYEMTNQRRQLLLEGMPYDSIEIEQANKELAMHYLFTEKWTPEMITNEHPELADYIQYPANYRFMQEVAEINMASYWKRVDTAVLLIHGAADFVSDAYEHTYVRDIVNHYHPGRAEYLELPNTDHFFFYAEDEADAYKVITEGAANRAFNEAALAPIIAFCEKAAGMEASAEDSQ